MVHRQLPKVGRTQNWRWLAMLVLVPAVLSTAGMVWPGAAIEETLTRRSEEALTEARITWSGLEVRGRDVRVSGVPSGRRAEARERIEAVTGVRAVSALADGSAGGGLSIIPRGRQLAVSGIAPDEQSARLLLDAIRERRDGREVVDAVLVAEGATLPADRALIAEVLAAVPERTATTVSMYWWSDTLLLTGPVIDEQTAVDLRTAVRAVLPAEVLMEDRTWQARLGETATFGAEAFQETVSATLADGGGLRFAPGSARLTASGAETLRQLAALLRVAPGMPVTLHGRAAGGEADLAGARAEAVRAELLDQGVSGSLVTMRSSVDAADDSDVDVVDVQIG
ncbi:outer membrane protein OmpA-like peptidoglycan-associated protein [Actinoalloteichus hoggarensis]|uniref:OmpA family protein n=1 Tax=Actinoalloteichus hoggarensis TaxID=1470176 RepID=A0A221WAU8_9PSEU|nr:OmpA family protein [Actinoalloteichus hoggarensis]ASO22821.1 OmpA family protein [Actinoalloteichus hoggarensis]MBB5924037.1 outer membrane protein OmpA-like peptidoglycan-associated protein [Actinoalloteichus hoggarensis]